MEDVKTPIYTYYRDEESKHTNMILFVSEARSVLSMCDPNNVYNVSELMIICHSQLEKVK